MSPESAQLDMKATPAIAALKPPFRPSGLASLQESLAGIEAERLPAGEELVSFFGREIPFPSPPDVPCGARRRIDLAASGCRENASPLDPDGPSCQIGSSPIRSSQFEKRSRAARPENPASTPGSIFGDMRCYPGATRTIARNIVDGVRKVSWPFDGSELNRLQRLLQPVERNP